MVLGRPVLDTTGLSGKFDFAWRPELKPSGSADASAADDLNLPDIFTAFREQLGLKLKTCASLLMLISSSFKSSSRILPG
jgi:uncharacterized protein (TIGR03435 family)